VDTLSEDAQYGEHVFPHSIWADSVLATLDWKQSIAQLLVPFSYSDLTGKTLGRMRFAVRDRGVGGVLISRGTASDARVLIDSMKRWTQVQLLISADFETGPGMRLEGAVRFPSMMAMAATRNADLIYRVGRAVAEASRDLGVQQNFAPVVDVNSNPRNPIINTRSFGERPELVAEMAEAYMRGMQDGGMIATAKHFPGHGDTQTDSHTGLPLLESSIARLDSVELPPFRRLIDAGVFAVMSGHLAVPAVTGDSSLPATLSAAVMDTLLQRKLGFHGLVVTDAMNMKALTRTGIANLPAAALRAGADILLIPGDIDETIDSIAAAVSRGEIDSLKVLRSVRRMLEAKHWTLDSGANFDSTITPRILYDRHRILAERIADRAITMLRNEQELLPLKDSSRIAVVSFVRKGEPAESIEFVTRMRDRFPRLRSLILDMRGRTETRAWLRDSLKDVDVVIFAAYISAVNGSGNIGLSDLQIQFASRIAETKLPRVLLSLGTPYAMAAIPGAEALLCSYSDDPASLQAAVRALAGDISPQGRLPVSIPGLAEYGASLSYRGRSLATGVAHASAFHIVDSLVMDQIARQNTPGAQLAVLRGDTLLYLQNYGHLSYDSASPLVNDSTMYDLASLTKVVATTSAAMQLIDQGRLQLDSSVAHYLPEFGKNGKEHITIRNLLLHNSGLEAFRPFYQQAKSGQEVLDSIFTSAPIYATGSKTVYSDLGLITLAKVIERVTGLALDVYARDEFFAPLRMRHTMFAPPDSLRMQCAPTEYDRVWRKRLVQGSVHDETAALLDGVAGHAGVFSTAADLARFVRMLMNGGMLENRRYMQPSTVKQFTTRQSLHDSRALGWDTRTASGSSAGRYFSMKSYGHTGFTGTSIWVDPVADIAVIFLTNRVHPTRENRQLPRFRAKLHDAVRESLSDAAQP
jgi:beta-glucosidase-like glycosyl hydrolase/CubicO group peptidase (beta-lactamase class C family)